ncbi:MAG: hypothetical protein JXR91_12585 [Deltaproteobacteria bacterium]|nr:hypothetical protein [Deltaproteobacteria bacterium]
MKKFNRFTLMFIIAAVMTVSANAFALQSAHSRKGVFTGIALGGGVSLPTDNTMDPLGDLSLKLQLGVGASQHITVSLDVDSRLEISNSVVGGLFVPGPKLTFFLLGGLNIHAGVGVAISYWDTLDGVKIGMDAGAGIGYEMWVNTKWAAYMNLDVDYFLMNEFSDLITINFWIGLRYY